MTEREKIIKIIADNGECFPDIKKCAECKYKNAEEDCRPFCTMYKTADAILEAGYGDVTEWKERAEKAKKERDEYRKSTHIALRGIEILKRNILRYFVTEFPNILQQVERELAEEEKDG